MNRCFSSVVCWDKTFFQNNVPTFSLLFFLFFFFEVGVLGGEFSICVLRFGNLVLLQACYILCL